MYIFPGKVISSQIFSQNMKNKTFCKTGLGLAAILSLTSQITDSMVEASALGLADSLTDEEKKLELLYPRIERSTFVQKRSFY